MTLCMKLYNVFRNFINVNHVGWLLLMLPDKAVQAKQEVRDVNS